MVERAILHLERKLESKLPPQPYLTGNKKGIWCIPHGCFTQQLSCCHVHFFPPGSFCGKGEDGVEGSSSGLLPSQVALFRGWEPLSAPFYLPGMCLSPSALHMFCGIACTLSFHFVLPNEIHLQWASNSLQLNQERPKKSLEDRGLRWGSRWEGIFQVHLCWNVHCCWPWWGWEKEEGRRLKLQPAWNSEWWLRRLRRSAESGTLCSTVTDGAKVVHIWCSGVGFIFVTARMVPFPRSFHFKLC